MVAGEQKPLIRRVDTQVTGGVTGRVHGNEAATGNLQHVAGGKKGQVGDITQGRPRRTHRGGPPVGRYSPAIKLLCLGERTGIRHDGVDLKLDWAREVLSALVRIWRRPVFLETTISGKGRRLGHDGSKASESDIAAIAAEESAAAV